MTFEGLVLGAASSILNQYYPGIAIQAVALTFGVLLVMLAAYSTGLVRVTQKFRTCVIAATGAICLFYFVSMILSLFGLRMPGLYETSLLSIGISLAAVIIAALNLALDFDLIDAGAVSGAPKYMEWYGGFALLVTLVWLYMEILELLWKMRSRD